MDFDHDEFLKMIKKINPEYVWLGVNSRYKQVNLPEPTKEKFENLRDAICNMLTENKINVRTMRTFDNRVN